MEDERASIFVRSVAVMLALAWAMGLLRAYVRICLTKRVSWEDYILAFALAALTTFAAMVPVQVHYGGGHHLSDLPASTNIPKWGRAFFVAEIMYLLTIWGVKTSVGMLILGLGMWGAYRKILVATIAVTTALTVAFIFWITFQCTPVEYQWDQSLVGTCASRTAYVNSVYALSAISALTDCIFGLVPALVIKDLQMGRTNKVLASFTITIGSFACIATLIRFKFIRDFAISEDVLYAMVPLCICSFAEASLGVICACIATLRPLLRHWNVIQSTSRNRSRGYEMHGSESVGKNRETTSTTNLRSESASSIA